MSPDSAKPSAGNPTMISFQDETDARRVVIEWLMSSVCNYSCSYCPTHLHDGRVRWPRYGAIVDFSERVCRHYAPAPTTFLLSGGEITLFPRLGANAIKLAVAFGVSRAFVPGVRVGFRTIGG